MNVTSQFLRSVHGLGNSGRGDRASDAEEGGIASLHGWGMVRGWWGGAGGLGAAARGTMFVAVGLIAAYVAAYIVRFEGELTGERWGEMLSSLLLVVPLKLAAGCWTGLHRCRWRDTTFADAVNVAWAITLGTILLIAIRSLDLGLQFVPRSVLAIDWAASILILGGAGGLGRLVRERWSSILVARDATRVLIVGQADLGEIVARAIRRRPCLGLQVVGLADSDHASLGRKWGGLSVLGKPNDLPRLVTRHRINLLVIPEGGNTPSEVDALLALSRALGLRSKVLPSLDAVLKGDWPHWPRDVDMDHLLGRDSVHLDGDSLGEFVTGKTVLVSGAAGSIGAEICRQAMALNPKRLVLLDHSENGLFYLERELKVAGSDVELVVCLASICDPARLRTIFAQHRPHVVLHAAAHKHVPLNEGHPGEAVKNNVFGTRNLVDEAIRTGVEAFVMISTDKAVNPTSVMGATKRFAEMYLQSLSGTTSTRLVTVRFGNVLGSVGSVVPIFLEQIRRGGPVTVTHPEMTRYFMSIPEAARLVLQAGALGRGGEIYVLDMGQPIRIVDLAARMIDLSKAAGAPDIEIVYTGLRPGEKLHEELYDQAEERLPTAHPKIFRAWHRPICKGQLNETLTALSRLVDGPPQRIRHLLSELVPGYPPARRGTGLAAPEPVVPAISHSFMEIPLGSMQDA